MQIDSIIISTVDRQPEYIHQTLASLGLASEKKLNIHLVVDGKEYSHYKTYAPYCKFYFNQPEPRADNNLKKATVNYARCLSLSRRLGGINLILEDDVLTHPDWINRLDRINFDERLWILSLNSLQKKEIKDGYGRFFTPTTVPQVVWCNTFAVIYSKELLKFLPELLLKVTFEYDVFPYDICIGTILHKLDASIYETVPSIVRHIGRTSLMENGITRDLK